MAETRFIRTVVFGGYDKSDVDKKLDYLYGQYFEMRSKLREAKLMLGKIQGGSDVLEAEESVLATERAKLTEFQVKNEAMSEKLKALDDENKAKDKLIAELKEKLAASEEALNEANAKLSSLSGGGDAAMLGVVFQQAQISANTIIGTAKQQASDLETDSKKLAENTVADANNKAKKIIYDAEVRAAQLTAEAEQKSADMEVASGNLKAAMLSDVTAVGAQVAKIKKILEEFSDTGIKQLDESAKAIEDASAELKAGGVPVFKEPRKVEAVLPEVPELEDLDTDYATGADEDTKKKNDQLDKLKAMADSIGGGSAPAASAPQGGGKVSLADLAKQAGSLTGGSGGKKSGDAPKSGGGLDDLLKKAKSIK